MEKNQSFKTFILDLAFNLVIPVLILQKGSKFFGENGPMIALVIALAFPVGFGLYVLLVKKKKNLISALGLINILFTGGFALMGLTKNWYLLKEFLLPALIAAYILYTTLRDKPFIEKVFYNESVFNVSRIESHFKNTNERETLKKHLLRSTQLLALSVVLSAVLNLVIAERIFTDIPYYWNALERAAIRNNEIAEMKKMAYFIIFLPRIAMTSFIIWHLVSGLRKMTGLTMEEIMASHLNEK